MGDGLVRELLRGLPVFAVELPEFEVDAAPEDPVRLFGQWLMSAIEVGQPEPHAMALGTADERGRPSSRVLICKDVDSDGRWYFASDRNSRKGRELAANPFAAMAFYWPRQGRQIRIRGSVHALDAEASAADFRARSEGSRAEALTGRQSQILNDPAELEAALRAARERLAADPELVAPGWTLYAVTADEVEFWQGDRDRRHIRLRYVRDGRSWARQRLWP
ncbi:pyridoxamine 5'-phosphate oxidase [Acrocarpospora corrugata]|uniref:Pyridoxamine 5'-phosphate oxidase n=1 Tax=Acrocarpospora corrugata TaxID=35763 RepID=A0A5M3VP15_9ACTN|nr:pyridoxal 5'-phosphate synthase [Acrocarpospora corrugata]GER98534.1 pyridoxamine 5'-phosphate oxidase [Acrocarpospora corrugata]